MLRKQLLTNQSKLYDNSVSLITESTSMSLVSGTPTEVVTQTTYWTGKGSIQCS